MTTDRRSFLAGGLVLAGSGQGGDPSVKVGVLNVKACAELYDRTREAETEIAVLRNRFTHEAEELRKRITFLTDKLEQVRNAPETTFETIRLRGHAEVDLKLNQEAGPRRVRDLAVDLDSRINSAIRDVVTILAKEQGLALVLRADEAGAGGRDVLFHAPDLDLTPTVVKRLNAEWKTAWVCSTCKRKTTGPTCRDCKKP